MLAYTCMWHAESSQRGNRWLFLAQLAGSLSVLSLSLSNSYSTFGASHSHVWYLPTGTGTGQWPASRPRRQCFAACDTGCPHARSVDTYKASFARSPPSRPANAPLRATFDRRLATTRRPRRHRANARLQCRDAAAGAGGWVLGRGRGREREQGGLDSQGGKQAGRQAIYSSLIAMVEAEHVGTRKKNVDPPKLQETLSAHSWVVVVKEFGPLL